MWTWFRHLLLIAIILFGAGFFLFTDNDSDNPAAAGLSRFYEGIKSKFRNSSSREKFIIELGEPDPTLALQLQQRKKDVIEPLNEKWNGDPKPRRFTKGNTLKNTLSDYAKQENITLYWHLNKDYVVKHDFRIDKSFTSALRQVAVAIDNEFEYDLQTFFCHNERAAIITEKPAPYIRNNCRKIVR